MLPPDQTERLEDTRHPGCRHASHIAAQVLGYPKAIAKRKAGLEPDMRAAHLLSRAVPRQR